MGLGDCIDCWDNPCTCPDKAGSPNFWANKVVAIRKIANSELSSRAKLHEIRLVCDAPAAPECQRCGSSRKVLNDNRLCDTCAKAQAELYERLHSFPTER